MLKILRLLKPYRVPVLAIFVVVFGQSMGDLYLPTLMSDIVNKGITNNDINYIFSSGALMLLVCTGGIIMCRNRQLSCFSCGYRR